MRRLIVLILATMSMTTLYAQSKWKPFEKLMQEGSYSSAYKMAEGMYQKANNSADLLAAAWNMSQAAAYYQEDDQDSTEARYRQLLPRLAPLEAALCHTFLGEYDEALQAADVLQRTPIDSVMLYVEKGGQPVGTPTVYDLVATYAADHCGDPRKSLEYQQLLVDFHATDDDDMRIWHDLCLIDRMEQVPNLDVDLDVLFPYLEKYRGSKSQYVASLYARVARYYDAVGDYVSAVNYCNTAIARVSAGSGVVECHNLRNSIMQKQLNMSEEDLCFPPSEPSLHRVHYRNLDKLWFKVFSYTPGFNHGRDKEWMKSHPLVEWSQAVKGNARYEYETTCITIPALRAGRYVLVVSPDESVEASGYMAYEMLCTDVLLIETQPGSGLLVDRMSGKPIVGQEVQLRGGRRWDEDKLLSTVVTDSDGRFHFETPSDNRLKYVVERNKVTVERVCRGSYIENDRSHVECAIRTDRPIYRPADTLHTAVVVYRTDGREAHTMEGYEVKVSLLDPNHKEVGQVLLTTDEFGVANAQFLLPTDRLAGQYRVQVTAGDNWLGSEQVRVEEYKQPKFFTTIAPAASVAPQFGQPYVLRGVAASYSQVPISDAKVSYTITRHRMVRFWWRFFGYDESTVVASGELVTSVDGSFEFTFVPEPDSNVELQHKPCFEYEVSVDVTDINGESHQATTRFRVGFRNAFLSIDGQCDELRTLDGLKSRYSDLNGNPLSGKVDMKIELLKQPAHPLLRHRALSEGVLPADDQDVFHTLYPSYPYSLDELNPSNWAVESVGWHGKSGVYRVTLSAADADTEVYHIVVTTPEAKQVISDELVWSEVDKTSAEVGETVTLRFGSRFGNVDAYYRLSVGNREADFQHLRLTDKVQTLTLAVDSSMLGGFDVEFFAVLADVQTSRHHRIQVPYSHKKLDVHIATFRDKLLPGEEEQWAITVTSPDAKPRKAALIMTLYDDALNSYGMPPSWTLSPWLSNAYNSMKYTGLYSYGYLQSGYFLYIPAYAHYSGKEFSNWTLRSANPYLYRHFGRRLYKSAMPMAINAVAEVEVLEEEEVSKDGAALESAVSASYMATADDISSDGAETTADAPALAPDPIRTNLSTLAFFAADVRTADDGTATYRFSIPELLTRWNLRILAFTTDLQSGTLERTLVTQKPLMVQPNMPRFLRSGDSLQLFSKVMNLSGEPHLVEVDFLLTDAATGDTICCHHQSVKVDEAASVKFEVEVPQNVYVAQYRIVATTDGASDGEQGQLPVVTNRQAVTLSQAVFINGVGERQFPFPTISPSSTAKPLFVGAEVVSNPVWLAVKSMPYLADLSNPSSIYLANQYYINRLGQQLLQAIPQLNHFDQLSTRPDSPLRLNQDVKQILLENSPWLPYAESEEEQMAAVSHFFDSTSLHQRLHSVQTQLFDRQNPDGGWSWMPDDRSSLWTTQHILRRIAQFDDLPQLPIQRALQYIDSEQQQYYLEHIKPYLRKHQHYEPDNIDYLFVRSTYGQAHTEAYRFYYSNAKKHYRHYEHLYTQAQLALIFHRHGDHREAKDLLRRIKEKALHSDEMGTYWRDNTAGWFWYQRPIETQALLIQAFTEISPSDTIIIGQMQQWLLKQKQTTHWGNDAATTEAIAALMVQPSRASSPSNLASTSPVELLVKGHPLSTSAEGLEGYRTQRWSADSLTALLQSPDPNITIRKSTPGIAWGAIYYQLSDQLDKLPSSQMGITLNRRLFLLHPDGTASPIDENNIRVGDRLRIRIDIRCDRAMDYLEISDGRPSCVEPLSTQAGWHWNEGLRYYVTVNNTDTRCFVEHLQKGNYYMEYEVFVTNPGTFLTGLTTMQCLYAPEFRSTVPALRLEVHE